ncbi:hypothetical protein SLE2022_123400 [Rubroshorea leprosula]
MSMLTQPLDLKNAQICFSTITNPTNYGDSKNLDSLRVWKEMKQNGFLSSSSSSHGGISVSVQNTSVVSSSYCGRRGRKSNKDHNGACKETTGLIASPTLLLPPDSSMDRTSGIIIHVRNRNQVHSIEYEALLNSESQPKH